MKPPEQAKLAFTRQWLRKAKGDLVAARCLLDTESMTSYPAAFHAQQTVEKFLKAALVWHQIEFPKTHDIVRLVDLIRMADAELAALTQEAAILTPYGVEARYPATSRSRRAMKQRLRSRSRSACAMPC